METTAVGQTNSIRRDIFHRLSEFRISFCSRETNKNNPQTFFTPQMQLKPRPWSAAPANQRAPEALTADLLSDR